MPIGREINSYATSVVHLVLLHLLLEMDMELSKGLSGYFLYTEPGSGSVLMVIVLIYIRL